MSRIYGGIHWGFDNTDGLACGRSVAEHVARKFFPPREAVKGDEMPAGFAVFRRDR